MTRLEAQFHFSSPSRDQVALLFFIGQEGLHEYGSDYVAISYVKGHILLTWDLGSGENKFMTKQMILVSRHYVGEHNYLAI